MAVRICILCDNGSVHNQKWVDGLRLQNDFDLHVISFSRGIKFSNVNYHSLKRFTHTKLDYLLNVYRVKKLLKQIKPDLLHAHYATSYGFLADKSRFHPFLLTGWGSDIFDSPKNIFMRKIVVNALAHADAVTVLSEITKKEVKRLSGCEAMLVPFGVDLNLFHPKKEKLNNALLRIGTIRTLSPKYGVEYLIKAFHRIHATFPNAILEIVGDGPQKKELQNLCASLNISDKVIFHGYINQKNELERYLNILQNFDVFAILSILDSETFGVAAVEALASGIPVVATRIGGLTEVVDDKITGIIVNVKDDEDTANALQLLLTDASLRKIMGENGRKKAETLYNWDLSLLRMSNLYRKLTTATPQ